MAAADSASAGRSLLQAALGSATRVMASGDDLESPKKDQGQDDDVEEKQAAGWTLLRSAFSRLGQAAKLPPKLTQEDREISPVSNGHVSQAASAGLNWPKTPGTWDRERAFDIADDLEGGTARETETDFTTPLRRSSKLWRFQVVRSEDRLKYRLFSEAGDFLMYAEISPKSKLVSFFLYDPGEADDRALYESALPTFSMSYSDDHSEWRLVQERCANCRMAPSHLSCSKMGKQQLAVIRHSKTQVGDGTCHCMDVTLPGIDLADGTSLTWCAMLGKTDLGGLDLEEEKQFLVTRLPEWSDTVDSLVLDFKGRQVLSSAKNFQLALEEKPRHVVCQFGKTGMAKFGLDFRYPLSAVQAFGISMTTLFWM